jgi:DNA-binding NtrC family response regulator
VLESGEVRPLGSGEVRKTDVRMVAATNRRLDEDVREGLFREDLFFRLAVIRLRLPPLRHRPEDIPGLVHHFLREAGEDGRQVGYDTMARLQSHPWPGNVRELKNYVERALALSGEGRLETVPMSLGEDPGASAEVDFDLQAQPYKEAKGALLDQFERRYWSRLLEETGWNVSEAARRGGIHRKSVEYLVRKLGLSPDESGDGKPE